MENMDRFLIKWYFYYYKGGEFYMVAQKFRKNSLQLLKTSVKARFPIFKLPFSFNFIYCMLWFWQRFWEPRNIFFWIFMVPYKIPHLCNNKNTIWLIIYTCFLSEIAIYNFPTCPGWPCINWLVTWIDRLVARRCQVLTCWVVTY